MTKQYIYLHMVYNFNNILQQLSSVNLYSKSDPALLLRVSYYLISGLITCIWICICCASRPIFSGNVTVSSKIETIYITHRQKHCMYQNQLDGPKIQNQYVLRCWKNKIAGLFLVLLIHRLEPLQLVLKTTYLKIFFFGE